MAKIFDVKIYECMWVNYQVEYTEKNYNKLKEHYKQYNRSVYDVLVSVSFNDVIDILTGEKEDIIFDYITNSKVVYKESVADIVKEDMRNRAYGSGVHCSGDVLDSMESIEVFEEEDDD